MLKNWHILGFSFFVALGYQAPMIAMDGNDALPPAPPSLHEFLGRDAHTQRSITRTKGLARATEDLIRQAGQEPTFNENEPNNDAPLQDVLSYWTSRNLAANEQLRIINAAALNEGMPANNAIE